MSKSFLTAAALFAAFPVLFAPSPADAYCGKTARKDHPTCVTAIRGPLAVRTGKSDHAPLICQFRNGRSFWAPRRAGLEDGTRWYSVKLKGVGTGYFSETRNGRMAIRRC